MAVALGPKRVAFHGLAVLGKISRQAPCRVFFRVPSTGLAASIPEGGLMPLRFQQGRWVVLGRTGFRRSIRPWVDGGTALTQRRAWWAMGPAERAFDSARGHQAQGTMRAHHVADHQIQVMVCDYMNGQTSLPQFVNLLGTLYQTSWRDVVLPYRLLVIWQQWVAALQHTVHTALPRFVRLPLAQQERLANLLVDELSSSIANLRMGHGTSDGVLGDAVAPRLQRGILFPTNMWDVLYLFSNYHRQPTFSFETSLVLREWNPVFTAHPTRHANRAAGFSANGILAIRGGAGGGPELVLSENLPAPGQNAAVMAVNNLAYYPGTQGAGRHLQRLTRSASHIFPLLFLVFFLSYSLYSLSRSNVPAEEI